MAIFKRFEEIKVWQKAREVTKRIYLITADEKFFRDFGLRDQIRRSAVSIMANIAEGNGRKTNKDFANFLVVAPKPSRICMSRSTCNISPSSNSTKFIICWKKHQK